MNRVIVIGPTYTNTIIRANEKYHAGYDTDAIITTENYGGSYLIAYNLAVLNCDTFYISRFSLDMIGNNLISELEKTKCTCFLETKVIDKTPTKCIVVNSGYDIKNYSDMYYDCYPALEDIIPGIETEPGDYGLINVVNSSLFDKVTRMYPGVKWIAEDVIPDKAVFPALEGIVLNLDHHDTSYFKGELEYKAMKLLDQGLNWIVVVNNSNSATIYSHQGKKYFTKEESGKYFVGTYETFVSMMTYCLTNNLDLHSAVQKGLDLANEFSYNDDMSL